MEDKITNKQILEKIIGIEGRFDGLEGRFDGLENRFSGIESQVDRLEFAVLDNRDAISAMDSRFDRVEGKIDHIYGTMDDFIQKQERQNHELVSLGSAHDRLQEKVEAHKS